MDWEFEEEEDIPRHILGERYERYRQEMERESRARRVQRSYLKRQEVLRKQKFEREKKLERELQVQEIRERRQEAEKQRRFREWKASERQKNLEKVEWLKERKRGLEMKKWVERESFKDKIRIEEGWVPQIKRRETKFPPTEEELLANLGKFKKKETIEDYFGNLKQRRTPLKLF